MIRKTIIFFWVFVSISLQVRSQLLDDSTKLVYGPKTTLYTTEQNMLYQRENWQRVDTVLTRFFKFTYKERSDFLWQDLGVVGTAMRPLYPQMPAQIGARPGFEIYAPYHKALSDFKYYDTKSPHIAFSLMLGGKGRSITDVMVTRNVTPRFNVGIHVNKLTIDKQIGAYSEGDRQVIHTSYDAFASYSTKNKKYRILANASRMRHQVNESGGVLAPDTVEFKEYFINDAEPKLLNSQSSELRKNIHVYQQFGIIPGFQAYHIFDRTVQKNAFSHIGASTDTLDFFDNFYIDPDSTVEQNRFDYYKNEAGLKGRLGRAFYNIYYKNRRVNQFYKYLDQEVLDFPILFTENYGGARFEFDFDSLTRVNSSFEYLSGGNFQLIAGFNSRFLNANFSSSLIQPSFIQKAYLGNLDAWYNSFKNPSTTLLDVNLKIKMGPLYLRSGIKASYLDNYIYFDQDTIPNQNTRSMALFNPSLYFTFDLPLHFTLSGRGIYTIFTRNAETYLHIPELFINAGLFYKNSVFKGAMETQIGMNFHWNSAYYADNYYPILQQFFLQDKYEIRAPLKVDFYLSGRLKSARVFLKFVNLKQMFTGVGNLVAPFYPDQRFAVDFGFTWYFYD